MPKRTRTSKTEKWIKEGRGSGVGADYKPWLNIQDVSSKGRSTRLKGIKTNRQHEFLSDLERNYFYLTEYSDSVVDIREQFPLLPLEETIVIADELGLKHPTDPKTNEPVVMTTDFLLTVDKGERLAEIARTINLAEAKGIDFAIKRVNKKISDYIEKDKTKKNPSSIIYNHFLNKKNAAFCLAKDICRDCSNGYVRNAHTISKSTIIKILSKDKTESMITFNRFLSFPKDNIEDYFQPIKDVEASIVNTYCKQHDIDLFKHIENNNDYRGDRIQNLELSLNSISINLYADILQILFLRDQLVNCRELWLEPRVMKDYAIHSISLIDNYRLSQLLIEAIVYDNKDILTTFNFEVKNFQCKFAYCETIFIEFDMIGQYIKETEHCMINIFPKKNGSTQIVLGILNSSNAYKSLFTQLEMAKKNSEISKILSYFALILSKKATNIYFEAQYFNELSEKEKAVIYYYYSINGAIRIAEDIKEKILRDLNEEEIFDRYRKTLFIDVCY